MVPETRYAKKDGVHIAYQVVGEGELDLLLVGSWYSHLEARWDLPDVAHYLRRLASFSRLISFDKQGMGLSDPLPLDRPPPLEEWMDDVRPVLDAVGCQRVAVMGSNEGCAMAALFAATHPERVIALVLSGVVTGRAAWAPDHPWGLTIDEREALIRLVETGWGTNQMWAAVNPSIADDHARLEAYARFFRLVASPGVAAAVTRMLLDLDFRDVLPAISAPTLVVYCGNPVHPVEAGRDVAHRIPGARFVEVPGEDYGFAVGDVDRAIDEVEEFFTGSRPHPAVGRALSTILFTDIVDSTVRAVELGDARWRELLEAHETLCTREVKTFGGVVSDFAGDGLLASFDGPARAVYCALSVRDELRGLGLEMRAGLHTGEIERRGDRPAGLGVHIASRILSLAQPGEVLVSRTVRDLVAGSGLRFVDHGTHVLKGVPDEWQVLAATEVTTAHP